MFVVGCPTSLELVLKRKNSNKSHSNNFQDPISDTVQDRGPYWNKITYKRLTFPWFQSKAEEAQISRFGGKEVWKCIRAMQFGKRGLIPSRSSCIHDKDGNQCRSLSEKKQRWHRHFSRVLNQESTFDMTELELTKQRPLQQQLAEMPTVAELVAAVKKLQNGKVGGNSGILPEMIKASSCKEEFLDHMLDLIHTVWETSLEIGLMPFSSQSQRKEI